MWLLSDTGVYEQRNVYAELTNIPYPEPLCDNRNVSSRLFSYLVSQTRNLLNWILEVAEECELERLYSLE